MQVYVVGNALLPYRITGDKNFFLDCFSAEWPANFDIHILSFTGRHGHQTQLGPSTWLHELSRPFHRAEFERYGGISDGLYYFRHQHGQLRELIERSSSLVRAAHAIRSMAGPQDRIVHYLDNFGPLMGPVAKLAGARAATTSSRPVGWPYGRLGAEYVRRTAGSLDYVGASSEAWAASLRSFGVPEGKVKRQRWGIRPTSCERKQSQSPVRLLWTGFIPMVGRHEFVSALGAARKVLASNASVCFQFLFKPESWSDEFAGYARPGIDVGVSRRSFEQQLQEVDGLFSPMPAGSLLTPPLSWLEAMANEVPLITSHVAGVEELIVDGQSGFVQLQGEELEETVQRALGSDLRSIGAQARQAVEQSFRLDQCIDDLIALWEAA
jgi:hypothetical protein